MSDCAAFDRLLEEVGDGGRFQKRFNLLFNLALLVFASMPNLNLYMAMMVPEHWCHVPGRENANHSLEEWKALTLPKEDEENFSSCKMYLPHLNESGGAAHNLLNGSVVDCQFGWDYDTTYYASTAPIQENWVCDRELHVTNTFVVTRIGDLVGNFVFGQVGDVFGRLPVYYVTLGLLIIGRVLTAFTTSSILLFLAMAFISSLSVTAIYQAPLVIAMEISKPEHRAHIAMLQCIGWTIAFCSVPLVMWAVGHWVLFILVTTLPCLAFFFPSRYLIESPRWLANKGKTARCVKTLKKIAEINGVEPPSDLVLLVQQAEIKDESLYGVVSLFSSWRLAKHTILLVFGWTITYLVYYVLTLNVSNLGGNPFVNFFWQGFAELPAYIIGKHACDRIGRRWTHISGFVGTVLFSLPLVFTVEDPHYQMAVECCVALLKFSISFAFYAVNLHALEIFPTCLRQTGLALCGITSNAIGPLGPYIVYLGTAVNSGYPYVILLLLGFAGALCGLFLPETLDRKLPETLAEGQEFGRGQKIWSFGGSGNDEFQEVKVEEDARS